MRHMGIPWDKHNTHTHTLDDKMRLKGHVETPQSVLYSSLLLLIFLHSGVGSKIRLSGTCFKIIMSLVFVLFDMEHLRDIMCG